LNLIPARGFVLGAMPYAESDKIVQLFTIQLGLVRALVKGARKPKSKLASSIDLFTESGFSLHKKAKSDLYLLIQAKIVDTHPDLKIDFHTITALQVLSELLAQFLPDAEPHEEVYSLLKETLVALEENPGNQELLLMSFGLKLLDLLGYPFELGQCAECEASLQRKSAGLVPHRGGALCEDCRPSGPGRLRITAVGIEVLKKLKTLPMGKVHVLKLKTVFMRELFLTVLEYLEGTLEKKLKMLEYYRKVMN
jgi:DNA repair protein RecO (recombination protein O)